VHARRQSLAERDRDQLPTGLVRDDEDIIKPVVGSTFDGLRQDIPDARNSLSPSSLKIEALNTVRVSKKLITLLNVEVVPGHGP
jgi:hypothetical protein